MRTKILSCAARLKKAKADTQRRAEAALEDAKQYAKCIERIVNATWASATQKKE